MAKKIQILIADDVHLSAFDKFPTRGYNIESHSGISNDEILNRKCDVLVIRSTRKIPEDFVNVFKGKIIASFTRGTDHIDLRACKRNGIKVISSNGGNSRSAAEHTIAMLLAIVKNICYSDKLIREGRFTELNFSRNELFEKKIGIIGYGSIGKKVAEICKDLGMDVLVNEIDPKVRKRYKRVSFKSLNYILKKCDIVSLHIPLEGNENFLSKENLSILREDSIFINTSRGEIVDENYLIKLLQRKRLKFAGLDVFKNEPSINSLLFDLDNVLLTNHIAGKTSESKIRIAEEVTSKIYKHLKKGI